MNMKEHQQAYFKYQRISYKDRMAYAFIIALALLSLLSLAYSCTYEPPPQMPKDCHQCHRRQAMTEYFKTSKNPEAMAFAVLNHPQNSKLLAAVAKVETGGNNVRKTGYKKRHDGIYQVNPKYHGKVANSGHFAADALAQTAQAERILTELSREMPIQQALDYYGGDTKGRYSRKILAELSQVP